MQWELVIALLIAVPVILFPAAFVWYLNIGGIFAAVREAMARRVTRRRDTAGLAKATGQY
jgi:hypothetical protein